MADLCENCGQKIRKPREKRLAVVVEKFEDIDMSLTMKLYRLVKQNFPFLADKVPATSEFEAMNKLRRIDGQTEFTIDFIINWCQEDEFWKKNIRSVAKLRKQFDTLMVQAASQIKSNNNKVASV